MKISDLKKATAAQDQLAQLDAAIALVNAYYFRAQLVAFNGSGQTPVDLYPLLHKEIWRVTLSDALKAERKTVIGTLEALGVEVNA